MPLCADMSSFFFFEQVALCDVWASENCGVRGNLVSPQCCLFDCQFRDIGCFAGSVLPMWSPCCHVGLSEMLLSWQRWPLLALWGCLNMTCKVTRFLSDDLQSAHLRTLVNDAGNAPDYTTTESCDHMFKRWKGILRSLYFQFQECVSFWPIFCANSCIVTMKFDC